MKNVKTENWLGRDFNLHICIGFESLTKINIDILTVASLCIIFMLYMTKHGKFSSVTMHHNS